MAIIALPTTSRFVKSIQWTLDRPAQVNRSAWTGRRQVLANPWHGKWAAKATLVPILGAANVLAWRSFLVQLKGQVNTFRLPASEKVWPAYTPAVRTTTAAGATSLPVNGFPAVAQTVMLAGQFFTLNDQLCVLTANAVTDASGQVTFTFEPPLRAAATATTAIEVSAPTCLVALTGSAIGWSADPGQIYGLSLDVEEAF